MVKGMLKRMVRDAFKSLSTIYKVHPGWLTRLLSIAGDVTFKPFTSCGKEMMFSMRLFFTLVILNELLLTCPQSPGQPEVIPHLRGIPTPALFWLVCVTRRFRGNDQCWDQVAVGATIYCERMCWMYTLWMYENAYNIDLWNFRLYTCTNRDRYR